MNEGFVRGPFVDGVHMRVCADREITLRVLRKRGWDLPDEFWYWLSHSEDGTMYLLTQGVGRPELWVHKA